MVKNDMTFEIGGGGQGEEEGGYDSAKHEAAWKKAYECGNRMPIGVIYHAEGVPTYEDQRLDPNEVNQERRSA